jgi:hypothetical protein
MIVGDVEPCPGLAFARHAGADDLGEAVDIERPKTERALERGADALRPRLGAEHAEAKPELARGAPLLGQRLGQMQRERRGRGDRVRPKVLQEELVAGGVAGGDRDHGHADSLGAVVEAEPAREEPVAEGDVQKIAPARARRRHHTRHHLAPDVQVLGRVGDDRRLALGAGRGVDASELIARNRQEPERVLLAQIRLAHEGKAGEIAERARRGRPEALTVKRNARRGPADDRLEPLQLQPLARLGRHRLGLEVPDRSGAVGPDAARDGRAHVRGGRRLAARRGGSGNCWSTIR